MSVLRQLNVLGQMRVDVPHLRSIESSIAADFDVVVGRGIAGDQGVVVRGFTLSNVVVGTVASDVQLLTADGIVYNVNASESGSFLWVPPDRSAEQLNTSNSKVSGSFTASAVNYIGIDFKRSADTTTTDLVQFLDANTLKENGRNVPLGRTLDYTILISTAPFSTTPNIIPVAKITTDSNNKVSSVQDARQMLYRLASGGDNPNPEFAYTFPFGRQEDNVTNTFTGGDKNILSNKDWMNAIMTRIWEIGGGENWYSPTADRNVRMIRKGSPAVFTNGENWETIGTHTHWQGLVMLFDDANNPGVYYNEIKDQLTDDTVNFQTQLAVGDCIYVDLDRTQNLTGANALVARKAPMQSLGTPTIPGSRYIIAWRSENASSVDVYTRDYPYLSNVTILPATTTSVGGVRLNEVSPTGSTPTVVTISTNNQVHIGQGSYPISGNNVALQATGGGNQPGIVGNSGTTWGFNAIGVSGIGQSTASIGAIGIFGNGGNGVSTFAGGAGAGGNGGAGGSTSGAGGDGGVFTGGAASAGNSNGGHGVVGQGGARTGTGIDGPGGIFTGGGSLGQGIQAVGGTNGAGITATANGSGGYAVGAFSGASSPYTIFSQAHGSSNATGITASGAGTGQGGQFLGGPQGDGLTGIGGNTSGTHTGGNGGTFVGGIGGATSGPGGIGASGTGGNATGGNSNGGTGIYGVGGTKTGTGINGYGVIGLGAGADGVGVIGLGPGAVVPTGGGFGIGVYGQGTTQAGGSTGVYGQATGIQSGVIGVGGSDGGPGVTGDGIATSAGVIGNGGTPGDDNDGGTGVIGNGGDAGSAPGDVGGDGVVGNAGVGPSGVGNGVIGNGGADSSGNGGGFGVIGNGGASTSFVGGLGGKFTGGSGNGNAANSSRGNGVLATGGAGHSGNNNGGHGIWGIGGAASGSGTPGVGGRFASTSTSIDVIKSDGYIDMSGGANPASNATNVGNRLTKKNIIKAWFAGHTDGSGGFVIDDGFNVTNPVITGDTLTVDFASGSMANGNGAVIGSSQNSTTYLLAFTSTTGHFSVTAEAYWTGSAIATATGRLGTVANIGISCLILAQE